MRWHTKKGTWLHLYGYDLGRAAVSSSSTQLTCVCVCVYVYKHASVPTCLAKETERLSNLDPCKDEKDMGAREGGKSWMRGEERDNVVGGRGGRVANGREREGRESTQRTEGTGRGALWRSLHRPRACSGPLQATAQNRALFFFSAFLLLLLLLCCQRKGRGFLEGSSLPDTEQGEAAGALQRWTEEGLLGGGSPLWGGHGDGVRATFSGR